MSRIGKKPISVPANVKISVEDNLVKVNGPLGQLDYRVRSDIRVEIVNGRLLVHSETRKERALFGLTRAIIANMVQGVTQGFSKSLEIQGLGYRAQVEKNKLVLYVGYTHPVEFTFPEGIQISADKQIITVKGIDKQLVGETAAQIRALRPAEPYKGTGIRYLGEYVRRKVGKAVVTAGVTAPSAAKK